VRLDLYQENLVALGSESCGSSQELGSDSCIQLYQRMHCRITVLDFGFNCTVQWINLLKLYILNTKNTMFFPYRERWSFMYILNINYGLYILIFRISSRTCDSTKTKFCLVANWIVQKERKEYSLEQGLEYNESHWTSSMRGGWPQKDETNGICLVLTCNMVETWQWSVHTLLSHQHFLSVLKWVRKSNTVEFFV
jgi:hypothetical protein